MFIPAICKCLLGVGINFSTIACEVMQQERDQAKFWLAIMNQLSNGMGMRREMMYCFLMAKAIYVENITDALAYARRALALSVAGAYRESERQNIANLVETLERRQ